MNGIAQYILSVTAAAMIAAIIRSLAGTETIGKVTGLMAGIFMAMTVLTPLLKLELPDMERWFSDFASDAEASATWGEDMAKDAFGSIITQRLETYIGDKAALYQAALDVHVELDESGIPVSVTLSGDVSPYAKMQLTRWLTSELGLEEEAQQWQN